MFLCAFSSAQPAELFPVLCFKAGVCVTHSKWHMWCSFLFQAVFWQFGSLVQAPCHCPSTPNPHPMSYHVSTHSGLLKMPVLCHNEVSKLTFNVRPRLQYSNGGELESFALFTENLNSSLQKVVSQFSALACSSADLE